MKSNLKIAAILLLPFYLVAQNQDQKPIFQTGNTNIKSLAVSPDGRVIAVEGDGSEVSLWNMSTRNKTATLKRNKVKPGGIEMPKASELEDLDEDEKKMLASLGSNPLVESFIFGLSAVSRAMFSQTGQQLIICNEDGVVAWDVKNPLPLVEFFAQPDFYDVSKDGQYIAVVEAATREENRSIAAMTRDDKPTYKEKILLYSVADGKSRSIPVGSFSETKRIRFIPGTGNLLVAGSAGELITLDLASGKILDQVDVFKMGREESNPGYVSETSMFSFASSSFAVHPLQSLAAITDAEKGQLFIYDFKNHQVKQTIRFESILGLTQGFEHLQFTPNGKFLLGVSFVTSDKGFKKTFHFWNTETGKEVKSMTEDTVWSAFSFSPDMKWLAFCKADGAKKNVGTISIYDCDTLNVVESFPGKGAFSFFPNDGKHLAYRMENAIAVYTIKK